MSRFIEIQLAAMAALAATGAARAADVSLLAPVTIEAGAEVPARVREECRIEQQVQADVGAALRRYNERPDTTTTPPGTALKVTITHVVGFGGGTWTGPKELAIRADLMRDRHLERTTKLHRTSMGGVGFHGTCATLGRDARVLARDVANWLGDPSYSIPDDATSDGPDPESGS